MRKAISDYSYLFYLYLAFALGYLVWRVLGTVNWEGWAGPVLLLFEIYNVFATSLFLFTVKKVNYSKPKKISLPVKQKVDIFIPTHNEPEEILRPTISAAVKVRAANKVMVLDDTNREWVKELAIVLGAVYVGLKNNREAKAGNLNNGLRLSDAEFIATFDADHVPEPDFIEKTIGYFEDPELSFVQTPQCFSNTDSFLFRKQKNGKMWSEQGMFYNLIQLAKNESNSAFFVGTSAIIRRSSLDSIGLFSTETATEDIHTSIKLHAKGWKSYFLALPLAYGYEAATFDEFCKQRGRWAGGSLGLLFRSKDSPIFSKGLSWQQRLNYTSATIGHLNGIIRLLVILFPICCLITNSNPIKSNFGFYAIVAISFAIFSIWLTKVFARGTYHTIYNGIINFANIVPHFMGVFGIIKIQKKFLVSEKVVRKKMKSAYSRILWFLVIISFLPFFKIWNLFASSNIEEIMDNKFLYLICSGIIFLNIVQISIFLFYLKIQNEQKHEYAS